MKLNLGFLMFLSVFQTPASWSQGTSTGGGGDNPDPADQAAWFLGDKTVTYCIDEEFKDEHFGASVIDVKNAIENAVKIWNSYLTSRHVLLDRLKAYGSHYLPISTQYHYVQKCDGQQDLKFYLGTKTNRQINEDKKRYQNPVAFAKREIYNSTKAWGRGYVWLASESTVHQASAEEWNYPNWKTTRELNAVLLHEIGHIYGNGHISGTIMDEAYSSRISVHQGRGKIGAWAERIDDFASLYDCESCVLQGTLYEHPLDELAYYPYGINANIVLSEQKYTFKLFVGREAKGKIRAEFVFKPKMRLKLIDDLGSFEIKLFNQKASEIQEYSMYSNVDHQVFTQDLPGLGIICRHLDLGTAYLFARDAENKIRTLTLDYNIKSNNISSPVQIRYFDGNIRRMLFLKNIE